MKAFLKLFSDLGYKKVVAIYDGDKKPDMENDQTEFPNYKFVALSTDDIRDKEERKIQSKEGLTDSKGKIKNENREIASSLIDEINTFLD